MNSRHSMTQYVLRASGRLHASLASVVAVMTISQTLSANHYQACAENCLEGLLFQCPALWKCLQNEPVSSLVALSGTSHGIRDFVLTHLTCLYGRIVHRTNEEQVQDSPFNMWSALQTLDLYELPDSAASYFANLDMQHLRCLHLSNIYRRSEPGFAATLADGQLPALEELHISHGICNISDLEHLARGQWPNLRVLKIPRYYNVTKKQLDSEMLADPLEDSNLPLLECLEAFRWSSIHLCKGTGERKWPKLEKVQAYYVTPHPGAEYANLRHIGVEETKFPECLLDVLEMQLPSLEHLQNELHPNVNGILDMGQVVNSGPWPHLTMLCIAGQKLGWYSFNPLQHADWRHLKELDLSCNCLDVEAVHCLAACNWPCLEDLALSDNGLDHDAVQHLIRANWPNLSTLYLCENCICNVAVQLLIKGDWPNLTCLFLSKNEFDADALQTLLQGQWPELSELLLDGTHISTHDAVEIYTDAACVKSCVFGHLLQEWCDIQLTEVAEGRVLEHGASLGFY